MRRLDCCFTESEADRETAGRYVGIEKTPAAAAAKRRDLRGALLAEPNAAIIVSVWRLIVLGRQGGKSHDRSDFDWKLVLCWFGVKTAQSSGIVSHSLIPRWQTKTARSVPGLPIDPIHSLVMHAANRPNRLLHIHAGPNVSREGEVNVSFSYTALISLFSEGSGV